MPEDEQEVVAIYQDSIPTDSQGQINWQILKHPLGELRRKSFSGTHITTYEGVLPPAEGGANNFAFFIHPLDEGDFKHYLFSNPNDPLATDEKIKSLIKWSRMLPPKVMGVVELTSGSKKCYGALICLFFLPDRFKDKEYQGYILDKQLEAFRLAQQSLGAGYVGLGAYNSINPRNIVLLKNQAGLPFCSGNSLTTDSTCGSVMIGSEIFQIDKKSARIAIVGAYGNIGQYLSNKLIKEFQHGFLIGPDYYKLIELQDQLTQNYINNTTVIPADRAQNALHMADFVVIAVSKKSRDQVIDVASLRPGTIVYDASVPQALSKEQIHSRNDVLFLSSGIYLFPGQLFDCQNILRMGDNKEGFACLAETSVRALAGQTKTAGVGDIKPEDVIEIHRLAEEFGFIPSGLRVMDHIPHKITPAEIETFKSFLNGRRP